MEPQTDVHADYSAPGAKPTSWAEGQAALEKAEIFWLSTVRPDGRPHVTPLLAAWYDGALYFCTGAEERKARNLEGNPNVALTTGKNKLNKGLDVVVEGTAVRTTDEATLHAVAHRYLAKYGDDWRFEVRNGAFFSDDEAGGHEALVFAVVPTTAFGFAKGNFAQTRWRF
jgi:nitroimidazol reductase NimA-like FMN-containing flavoprotein (pyridoxamine 5'-phosphate oxidase superfamily)